MIRTKLLSIKFRKNSCKVAAIVMLGLVSVSGAMHADESLEQQCQVEGGIAERIAQNRDAGVPLEKALSAIKNFSSSEPSREAASIRMTKMLYGLFKYMTPETARLEFYADCLDQHH
jgi:hypothetical protein